MDEFQIKTALDEVLRNEMKAMEAIRSQLTEPLNRIAKQYKEMFDSIPKIQIPDLYGAATNLAQIFESQTSFLKNLAIPDMSWVTKYAESQKKIAETISLPNLSRLGIWLLGVRLTFH